MVKYTTPWGADVKQFVFRLKHQTVLKRSLHVRGLKSPDTTMI